MEIIFFVLVRRGGRGDNRPRVLYKDPTIQKCKYETIFLHHLLNITNILLFNKKPNTVQYSVSMLVYNQLNNGSKVNVYFLV